MRIAIMPARGGSKRIPHKNITPFCGKPLMAHALAAAQASGLFDTIHVSTEDAAIAAAATAMGLAPDFARDPALADDHTSINPVLKWVLEQYRARGRTFDTVCLLMPTAPLIEASDLQQACALFDGNGAALPVLAAARLPVPVEWAMRLDGRNELKAADPQKAAARSQDLEKAYYDSGTFIFFPAAQLLDPPERTSYLGYLLPRHKAVDIDDPEDLDLAERLYRGRP